MKQETKELISWLKEHLSHYRIELATGRVKIGMVAGEKEEERAFAAIDFLNSLPEIESQLCRGGYIQDKNGTPCCHGDKVVYKTKEYTLKWSKPYSRFILEAERSVRDIWDFGNNEILKVGGGQ